jgi:hypothetical protein
MTDREKEELMRVNLAILIMLTFIVLIILDRLAGGIS